MSQGPPQKCSEDWRKDNLSVPCAFILVLVPPAYLVPYGNLKLLGKPVDGQRGISFLLIVSSLEHCEKVRYEFLGCLKKKGMEEGSFPTQQG